MIARTVRRQRWRRTRIFLALAATLSVIAAMSGPTVGGLLEALTPPRLPAPSPVTEQLWRGDQTWTNRQADEFHFISQGTHTFPIPLSWFLALEQPLNSPLAIPFATRGRFADDEYLSRFGFIRAAVGAFNPYGLPIGFAISPYQTIAGISRQETAVGLTCAACHTGQLVYDGKRYIIDGGPAATDLGQLTRALGAALGQTAASEKLPLFDGRFTRFAQAVLGRQYSTSARTQLAKDVDAVIRQLAAQPNGIDVTEGFGRLDALNRIGNQVFALDTHRYDNYVNINAPVNYPHIWTSSWFTWIQYDGSIMQPLVRNAGEAMGVSAAVMFTAPPGAGRFASSIRFDNLHWIEQQLAGTAEPLAAKAFTGLNAPRWPESFPPIDAAKAARGAALYAQHCEGCHRPALTPDVADGKAPTAAFWQHFVPVRWSRNGEQSQTQAALLDVAIIPRAHIGTDPAQAAVLGARRVNTAGVELARAGDFSPGLGIDADICVPAGEQRLRTIHIADDAVQPYPWALGAVVQMGIDAWLRLEARVGTDRATIESDRPNCLQAGAGYKARPLNGVWATAPFLHNGSVPTLYDLLSPVEERPKAFLLGDPSFDPERVGLVTRSVDPKGRTYDETGYFILDTATPGNRNTGHEFSDRKRDGVIGPALSPDDRKAIIEFLKSI